jgi:hypothetical protein
MPKIKADIENMPSLFQALDSLSPGLGKQFSQWTSRRPEFLQSLIGAGSIPKEGMEASLMGPIFVAYVGRAQMAKQLIEAFPSLRKTWIEVAKKIPYSVLEGIEKLHVLPPQGMEQTAGKGMGEALGLMMTPEWYQQNKAFIRALGPEYLPDPLAKQLAKGESHMFISDPSTYHTPEHVGETVLHEALHWLRSKLGHPYTKATSEYEEKVAQGAKYLKDLSPKELAELESAFMKITGPKSDPILDALRAWRLGKEAIGKPFLERSPFSPTLVRPVEEEYLAGTGPVHKAISRAKRRGRIPMED